MQREGWSAFGHTFSLETPVPQLTAHLAVLFDALPRAPSRHHYEVVGPDTSGRWRVVSNGESVESTRTVPHAVALLLWAINRGVITGCADRVLLHAGGVRIDGVGILLPGEQEAGKSTLTAGLLRAGADYLGDEAIGLKLDADLLEAYPKALSLDPGSWPLFPELEPNVPGAVRRLLPAQWQVAPAAIPGVEVVHTAVPGLVILPRHLPGAATTARRLRGVTALSSVLPCVFPTTTDQVTLLRRLARLLDHVPCVALTYSDLASAVTSVHRFVRTRLPADTKEQTSFAEPRWSGRPARHVQGSSPQVTGSAVFAPRAGTSCVNVDGEAVLHVAGTGDLVRLNLEAAAIWDGFDGHRPLSEVIRHATTPDDKERIPPGIVAFVAELCQRRLLSRQDPKD